MWVAQTRTFQDVFCDPYDVRTSFQLSDRLRGTDQLKSIGAIKDADAALRHGDYLLFLRLIKRVIAFLNPSQRRRILSRIIYNDLYLKPFKPETLALAPRTTTGRFSVGSLASVHRELEIDVASLQHTLVKDSRKRFHDVYGFDVSRSSLSIRCSISTAGAIHSGTRSYAGEELESSFRATNSTFLHLDQKKGITTILYLSDVSAADGAFRYVEGSALATISPILKSFHEFVYNDLNISRYEDVMGFPPEFRAGINYYFWLEPEKQRVIDSFTRTLTGVAGTGICFAGNTLLHGGGIPSSGQRAALFIAHTGYVVQRLRQLVHPLSILQRAGLAN